MMEIYKIQKLSNDTAIVLSMSCVNPISYLPTIEKDLSSAGFTGEIIFDLLLCNGNSSNRYVKGNISNGKIDRKSMKVIGSGNLAKSFIEKIQEFYKSHKSILDKSIILENEQQN